MPPAPSHSVPPCPPLRWALFLSLSLSLALAACGKRPDQQPSPSPTTTSAAVPAIDARKLVFAKADVDRFRVLPARWETDDNPITEAKVKLGRTLFYDPRLSKNQDVSCNSCHDLESYGADHVPFSAGHRGQLGGRNAPTVYNAGGHLAQFWDGRANTLEEQAKGPILNPVEMAMPSEGRVVETLKSIPGYVVLFKNAFPKDRDPVTYDTMAKAIGAFERQLVTPSRFDRYLAGDASALTDDELAGFHKFTKLGCLACHDRAAIGGTRFATLGMVKPYPGLTDNGRYDVTKEEQDRHRYRVPSLRNVEKTGPYFHDGSVATLDQVVRKMAFHQLGTVLTDDEAKVLVAFLKSLTGEIPRAYIQKPALPPSGPKTPKPDAR